MSYIGKTVAELKDLPKHEHFAVLIESFYHYSTGYENVGEYGTKTSYLIYIAFPGLDELNAWLLENETTVNNKKVVQVIGVTLYDVKKKVSIETTRSN